MLRDGVGLMSASEVARAAYLAGFRDQRLVEAIAVALAESGGDPGARHVNVGGTVDRGAWQINDHYHSEVTDTCAYDVYCAARAAYTISAGGSDWTPWSTYTSGAYQAHMQQAAALAANVDQTVGAIMSGASGSGGSASGGIPLGGVGLALLALLAVELVAESV